MTSVVSIFNFDLTFNNASLYSAKAIRTKAQPNAYTGRDTGIASQKLVFRMTAENHKMVEVISGLH